MTISHFFPSKIQYNNLYFFWSFDEIGGLRELLFWAQLCSELLRMLPRRAPCRVVQNMGAVVIPLMDELSPRSHNRSPTAHMHWLLPSRHLQRPPLWGGRSRTQTQATQLPNPCSRSPLKV